MLTLQSHSHLRATPVNAQTKTYKRVCLPNNIMDRNVVANK